MLKFKLKIKNLGQGFGVIFLLLSPLFASCVLAAETLILKIGPLERSLPVADLAQFAENGEITDNLKPYSPLLSPKLRELLSKTLTIDPNIGDQLIEELSRSSAGKALLDRIITALPDSNIEILKAALSLAVRQTNNLSIVNILQAYPQENITVDLTQIVSVALQINGSHLQSQLLNPIIDRSLKQETNNEDLPPLNPALSNPVQVYQRTLNFNDTRRRRQIPVDLYYSDQTQAPLVVMSHGFSANRQFMRYLAIHLASHGFTVASVEHPGSNINIFQDPSIGLDLSKLLPASEFVDRPQDISFVLDQLTQLNQTHATLAGKLHTDHVTVIGHSFGGYTALALAGGELNINKLRDYCDNSGFFAKAPADWLQCAAENLPENTLNLRDERVKNAIALNPLVGELFGDTGLENITIPTLILASGDDSITPTIPHQIKPFDHLRGEKYLIVALGATHMSVTDHRYAQDALTQNNITNELISAETDNLKEVIKGLSLAFILQFNTSENPYQPFLSANYVQSLSNQKIQLRFTQEIPQSLENWLNGINLTNYISY